MRKGIIASLSVSALFAGAAFSFFISPSEKQTVLAQSCPAGQKPFVVYTETNYKNQPNLEPFGVNETGLRFLYGQFLWKKGQDQQQLPTKDYVIQKVAAAYKDYTGHVVINIEHINIWGSDAVVAAGVKKLITILEWVKLGAPKARVSYFSILPAPGGYHPSQGDPALWEKWQKKSNRLQALADHQDAIFPDLYAHLTDQAGWVKAATGVISEAKRLGKGKPVYLVINPRYHSNAGPLRFKPIPSGRSGCGRSITARLRKARRTIQAASVPGRTAGSLSGRS